METLRIHLVSGADIAFGVLLLLVGAAFCFQGYLALRLLIPIWGTLVGFSVGAGMVAAWTDEGFLATTLGWIIGLIVAVVFGLLAYLYYAVSVVIAMGAIGFLVGTSIMYAFDVQWEWRDRGRRNRCRRPARAARRRGGPADGAAGRPRARWAEPAPSSAR